MYYDVHRADCAYNVTLAICSFLQFPTISANITSYIKAFVFALFWHTVVGHSVPYYELFFPSPGSVPLMEEIYPLPWLFLGFIWYYFITEKLEKSHNYIHTYLLFFPQPAQHIHQSQHGQVICYSSSTGCFVNFASSFSIFQKLCQTDKT